MNLDLILEVAALVGLLLLVAGLAGRVSLSRPRCRACGCDLRPVARALPPDGAPDPSTPCPGCGASLRRSRQVRWRPRRVQRRVAAFGGFLLVASLAARLYGIHLGRQGLFWTDLSSTAPIIERVTATPPTATMDDWLTLARRARADRLSAQEIDTLLAVIERTRGPRQGSGSDAMAPASASTNANQISAFLEGVLRARGSMGGCERVWALLAPLPLPATRVDATDTPGRFRVRVKIGRAIRPNFGWARSGGRDVRPLLGLLALRGARVDGNAVELRPVAPSDPLVDVEVALSAHEQMELEAQVEAVLAPGDHMLEIDIASAGVDIDLVRALCDGLAKPGPPKRWGSAAPVTITTLRVPFQVPAPDVPAAPANDAGPSEPVKPASAEESPS